MRPADETKPEDVTRSADLRPVARRSVHNKPNPAPSHKLRKLAKIALSAFAQVVTATSCTSCTTTATVLNLASNSIKNAYFIGPS